MRRVHAIGHHRDGMYGLLSTSCGTFLVGDVLTSDDPGAVTCGGCVKALAKREAPRKTPVTDTDACPTLDGLRHYEVVSPTMTSYSIMPFEPAEGYVSFVIVSARNKREAVKAALKTDDFDEWRTYARRDGINPFSGVKAELTRCEHGSCWACNANEESSGCPTCDAQVADEWAKIESEIGS